MTTNNNLQVANEILRQMGGNKFIAMTGSKNFIASENTLSMHLTHNKARAKYLKITLEANDTYTMVFSTMKKEFDPAFKAAGINFKTDVHVILKTIENVYFDQLQPIFTSVTGLYTSL